MLYKDFPSEDPTVRLVLLLTIFLSESTPVPSSLSITSEQSVSLARYVEACHDEIEEMNLGPLTRKDITDVLLSKFVPERFGGILEYARAIVKLGKGEMDGIVTDVALGCLEIGCKGRMLKKLVEAHEFLGPVVATHIVKRYRIDIDDLPPMEDEKACKEYSAPLCVDLMLRGRALLGFEEAAAAAGPTVQMPEPTEPPHVMGSGQDTAMEGMGEEDAEEVEALTDNEEDPDDKDPERDVDHEDLVCHRPCATRIRLTKVDLQGTIGQDTLSAMIRKDEMIPTRRRRYQELYTNYHDSIGKLPYPAGASRPGARAPVRSLTFLFGSDYTQVGTWIQNHFGHLSAAAAVVRIHAVINQNYNVSAPARAAFPVWCSPLFRGHRFCTIINTRPRATPWGAGCRQP